MKSWVGNRQLKEFELLRVLDHPNILQISEVIEEIRYYHMVSEYCSGGELFDRINKQEHFSENEAAKYMKQILGALKYCHDNKIIHKDIKPENILF